MRRLAISAATIRQFSVFVIGGALSACVDIGTMLMLLTRGIGPLLAATLGFCAGLFVNYAYHAKFTFAIDVTLNSILKYLTVVTVNYLATVMLVWITDELLHSPLAGKLISLPIVALIGFCLSRRWAFR